MVEVDCWVRVTHDLLTITFKRNKNTIETKMKLVIVASVLFLSTAPRPDYSEAYRILGVFPLDVRSHFMMHEALMKGLARKGHQVDVVSTFPQRKPYPNYTDIITLPSIMTHLLKNVTYDNINARTNSVVYLTAALCGNDLCTGLEHPKMLELIRNPPRDPSYDLVITEALSAHCFLALGYHLKVPTIGVHTAALYPWQNGIVANPANLAFVPDNLLGYVAPLTFWERLWNTVHAVSSNLYYQYITRVQDDIIKQYFGEDAPSVRELEINLALVLANTHPALNGPKPVTNALIEVGGLHIQDNGPELPRDLIEWMDESTEGFVYFTFGSMVKIESFPEKTIRVFYKSLEKIAPIRVLIKIPEPDKLPSGVPKNFRTFNWTTQYKVLKHKNVKAFITHGGLMGTLEAIYCAVPMIGIPLFADQFTNIHLYTAKKMAVKLDSRDITERKLDEALNEILYNPVYKNTVLDMSAKFIDRPMSAMDTATWWVEYVIRHGSNDLRSPAMDLAWWQIELLDVYGFILLIAALAIFMSTAAIKFFIGKFFVTIAPKVKHSKKVH